MLGARLIASAGGPRVPILDIRPRENVNNLLTVDIAPRVEGNFARVKNEDIEALLKELLKDGTIQLVNFHMSYPELTSRGLTGIAQAKLNNGQIQFGFEKSEKTGRKIMFQGREIDQTETVPSWESINLSEYALAIDKNTRVVIFIERDFISDKIPFIAKEDLIRK